MIFYEFSFYLSPPIKHNIYFVFCKNNLISTITFNQYHLSLFDVLIQYDQSIRNPLHRDSMVVRIAYCLPLVVPLVVRFDYIFVDYSSYLHILVAHYY